MFRLILLLLGNDFVRRRWPWLALLGALWAVAGLAIFIDALDGVPYFPIHVFGYLLIAEAVVTLVATPFGSDTRGVLRKARGVVFLVVGLVVVDGHHGVMVALAIVFGLAFLVDGLFRMIAAVVVRNLGWRMSLVTGLCELGFAAFMFEPYPTFYAGTVPYCIGMALFLSGCGLVRAAVRLRRLPAGAAVSLWLSRDSRALAAQARDDDPDVAPAAGPLAVHVWTPTGAAEGGARLQPVVDRYIAAVDSHGVVSTGHAALEAPPDVYISHYPRVEIDRSGSDFARMLRATAENNVEGLFQPSYAEEAAGWCESTVQVHFPQYNRARLVNFWRHYSVVNTYNLTSRNCSSTVAHALEAALEGSLAGPAGGLRRALGALFSPELWVAAQLHRRAEAMAWTPGLVLDYARTLKVVLAPTPPGFVTLAGTVGRAFRYAGKVRRREPVMDPAVMQRQLQAKARDDRAGEGPAPGT